MNFRTTLILLVLLAAVGAYVFFSTRDTGGNGETQTTTKKLIDLDAKDVTRVILTPASGPRMVFERPADGGNKGSVAAPAFGEGRDWKMIEPVAAGTQSWQVDALVRDLTGLESRSLLDEAKKASVGLDKPAYTVELSGNGKTAQIAVGNKSAVGDNLYVQVAGHDKVDVVPSTVYDSLDKPAADYRSKKLVETTPAQVQELTVSQPGQPDLRLEKSAGTWKIIAPTEMPGDSSAISDLVSAVTSLNAEEFVADKPGSPTSTPAFYGFTNSPLTVSISTRAPETQPATSPASGPTTAPAATILTFGRPEDLRRKNVFLSVAAPGAQPTIAKVPTTSLEALKKRPLDLRDRNVLDVTPDDVSEFTLSIDSPSTTQPTTRPAEQRTLHIARRKENLQLGPAFSAAVASPSPAVPATGPSSGPTTAATQPDLSPTTQPSTLPSTQPATVPSTSPGSPATQASAATPPSTQPASQPVAEKPSKWAIESEGGIAADDGQVSDLLAALHPLKAVKYLDQPPTSQPSTEPSTRPATQPTQTTYTLALKTVGAGGAATSSYDLRVNDPGGSAMPTVHYRDLTFEVERTFVRKLEGDFKTRRPEPVAPPPSSAFPSGGFPGGLPPGHPGAE